MSQVAPMLKSVLLKNAVRPQRDPRSKDGLKFLRPGILFRKDGKRDAFTFTRYRCGAHGASMTYVQGNLNAPAFAVN